MALPTPILDDRSYEQLRDELVRRIPVYAPEWTDHNPSDPGITLIELFAFLGENVLYRFNQVPEKTKLEFLNLLQIPRRAAQPAAGFVEFSTEATDPALVERGTEVRAGKLPFEALTEVDVHPVSVAAYSKSARQLPGEGDDPEVVEFFRRAVDALNGLGEGDQALAYENERVPLEGGLPVDFDEAVDGILWVAVLAAEGENLEAARNLLAAEADPSLGPRKLNLSFLPDLEAPPVPMPCPGEGEDAGPPVNWEISTGQMNGTTPRYRRLRTAGDTTDGLTREGVVRVEMPTDSESMRGFPTEPDSAGTGDLPPALDDETAERLLFWLRAYRPDGSRFGKVLHVGANAAQVVQSRRALTEFVGTGTGLPDQRLELAHRPVLAGALAIEVEGTEGWRGWREVDGLHASTESDLHYVLDAEGGSVLFGNGFTGYAPQLGQRIRAVEYRYGGGARGNVAVGAIAKITSSLPVDVTNPFPTHGGADTESIERALDRIPGEIRRRDRAVTRDDFAELARMTPGMDVGRAEVIPRFHPPTRQEEAAGVVTVVVWPAKDAKNPSAPRPDCRMLATVCKWLDQRRLITTELFVVEPRYRRVAVSVAIKVKPGYGVDAVRNWVELVLRQFLAPLPPYGPEGGGWPLGRRVYGPELEAAALQVEGVEYLEALRIAEWSEEAEEWRQRGQGPIVLDLDEAAELAEVSVVEGVTALTPGDTGDPPEAGKSAVPIPVPREEC